MNATGNPAFIFGGKIFSWARKVFITQSEQVDNRGWGVKCNVTIYLETKQKEKIVHNHWIESS